MHDHGHRQRQDRREVRAAAVRRAECRRQIAEGGQARDQEGVLLGGQGDDGAVHAREGTRRLAKAEARKEAEAAREGRPGRQ